jgi:monofunctional chorismate mutase
MTQVQLEQQQAARPAGDADTDPDALQSRLDGLDVRLLTLVRQRTALARQVAEARRSAGGTRFVHEYELTVVRRFLPLGEQGAALAALLLRLAR